MLGKKAGTGARKTEEPQDGPKWWQLYNVLRENMVSLWEEELGWAAFTGLWHCGRTYSGRYCQAIPHPPLQVKYSFQPLGVSALRESAEAEGSPSPGHMPSLETTHAQCLVLGEEVKRPGPLQQVGQLWRAIPAPEVLQDQLRFPWQLHSRSASCSAQSCFLPSSTVVFTRTAQ